MDRRFLLGALVLGLAFPCAASPLTLAAAKRQPGGFVNFQAAPGVCGVAAAGNIPTFCADFKNGFYVLNGVQYASFTAMGGTLGAGCTITLGTGMQCPSGAPSTVANFNPSQTGYMVVNDAARDTATGFRSASTVFQNGSTFMADQSNGTGGSYAYFNGASALTSGSSGADGKNALYANSATTLRVSFGGSAVQGLGAGGTAPAANSTLQIAEAEQTAFYTRSVRMYVGSFTDAQVQLAATQ